MNLYQKYRSKNFDEIIGHKKEVAEFKKRSREFDWPQSSLFISNSW